MRFCPLAIALLLVPVGCVDRPLQTSDQPPGTTSEAETGTGGTVTDSGAGTTGTTGSEPTTTGTTGTTGTTEGVETGSTGSSSGGGLPSTCGPPCADTWELFGSLDATSSRDLSCLTHVHGDLWVTEFADLSVVATLGNLIAVDGTMKIGHPELSDLSMFGCLKAVATTLVIEDAPKLVEASLPALQFAPWIELDATGLTALPTLGPNYEGVERLQLFDNPALVDLSPASGWPAPMSGSLTVILEGNATLPSLAGLGPLLASPAISDLNVQVIDHPALTSLAGLDDVTYARLHLQKLPALPDLDPLKKLSSGSITLLDIPKVTDLSGLSGLKNADELIIGDCVNMNGNGMDGLTSLAGLDNLMTADVLGIANNDKLASLTGAPKLTTVGYGPAVINNPALTQAEYDQFIAQLDAPFNSCFGAWEECYCFEVLPW